MPSRLLREGILDSERVNALDWPEEVFYRRLMSKVDDYGLFDARPAMLRSSLYPLKVDKVREADITRWIAACEKAGVIALYASSGPGSSRRIAACEMAGLSPSEKAFGQMLDTKWQARSEPKHPLPPWGSGTRPPTPENSCKQEITPVPVFGDVVGDVKPPPPPQGGAFDRFWKAWPSHPRKVAKEQCRDKWKAKGCEAMAEGVLAALEAMKASEQWRKNDGEFVPSPLVWLNQARWEAPTAAQVAAEHWHETRSGIEAKGVELGAGRWDESAFGLGQGEPWPAYQAKVFRLAGYQPARAA